MAPWFLDDIKYVKRGGVLKPTTKEPEIKESPKLYGPSKEYLDFMNTPPGKHANVIEVDFKEKKRK